MATVVDSGAAVCSPAGRVTKSLLGYGVIAGPFYVVLSLAEAFTRDGFDPSRHAWSMLANGRLGWIHVFNLVFSGLMVVAAAVGVRRAVGSVWAGGLLAVYGVGMIVAGFFKADPGQGFPPGTSQGAGTFSASGFVHFAAGGVGFVALVAACFVLARRFDAGFGRLTRVVAVVFFGTFVALSVSGGASWGIVAFSVGVVLISAWLSVACVRLFRTVR
jgi:hypothetical protein